MTRRTSKLAPASTLAPFYYWEPIVSIALAAAVLGERLTLLQFTGMTVVIAAGRLATAVPGLQR